jgi:hypothetical protein
MGLMLNVTPGKYLPPEITDIDLGFSIKNNLVLAAG